MGDTHDERPSIWTGHIAVPARDVGGSADFYERIGMRPIAKMDEVAIFELRGGTHLVVHRTDAEPGPADFDLMVEDLASTHAGWEAAGLPVGAIEHGSIHDSFTVTDPAGNSIVVNSTHVAGPV
jgi:catechol 2,3-dioxygenase-like lactoylglutathione lyase family enzyme